VVDGYGDETAQSAYTGIGNRLERVSQSQIFDSLGMPYTAVTEHLGFRVFEEGTVMALAATGYETYLNKFREVIQLKPDGEFSVCRDQRLFLACALGVYS
jgi:carbamoyltransferase